MPNQTAYNSSQAYGFLKNNNSSNYFVKDSLYNPNIRETINRVHSSSLEGNIPAKYYEAMNKHKEINQHLENERIQELGEKLEKIERSKVIVD